MKDIDKIIEKYFEGETSLDEEQILRDYFSLPAIREEHKLYAPMFNFFSDERKEIQTASMKEKRKRLYLPAWIGVAACIAILIGCFTLLPSPFNTNENKSLVYINGVKTTDINIIQSEALNSIDNISEMNDDIINSQIDIINSFIE